MKNLDHYDFLNKVVKDGFIANGLCYLYHSTRVTNMLFDPEGRSMWMDYHKELCKRKINKINPFKKS